MLFYAGVHAGFVCFEGGGAGALVIAEWEFNCMGLWNLGVGGVSRVFKGIINIVDDFAF
jgi:hypothetical protein